MNRDYKSLIRADIAARGESLHEPLIDALAEVMPEVERAAKQRRRATYTDAAITALAGGVHAVLDGEGSERFELAKNVIVPVKDALLNAAAMMWGLIDANQQLRARVSFLES